MRHDLIVVASLIDKVPNLGGLARTVEVLGAGALVLSDLRFASEAGFTRCAAPHYWQRKRCLLCYHHVLSVCEESSQSNTLMCHTTVRCLCVMLCTQHLECTTVPAVPFTILFLCALCRVVLWLAHLAVSVLLRLQCFSHC
jgi:hypothetical protein